MGVRVIKVDIDKVEVLKNPLLHDHYWLECHQQSDDTMVEFCLVNGFGRTGWILGVFDEKPNINNTYDREWEFWAPRNWEFA